MIDLYFLLSIISGFVFLYPLLMSFVWMVGGLIFFLRRERQKEPPPLKNLPFFSIILPCYNEEYCIEHTIHCLMNIDYPNFEVIVVNDGSTDNTRWILEYLIDIYPRLRVVNFVQNQGKATALNYGILVSRGEYLLCLDADGLLDRQALRWLAWHFVNFPRVGAVTGNPRVINRSSLLSKIQIGEFATIIGLIKRTQRLLGKVLTVSGVMAAFRKKALLSVGLFDPTMATEDIDITWKLQKNFWDIRYEPRALSWIYVPETLKGLWRQRVRWAQGGVEVVLKHWDIWKDWRQRRLWPIYIEYLTDIFWAYGLFILAILSLLEFLGVIKGIPFFPAPIPPRWTGAILGATCVLQFFLSLILERRYEKYFFRYYFWVLGYPFCYWFLSAVTMVYAVPKVLFKRRKRARWKSPDRGLGELKNV